MTMVGDAYAGPLVAELRQGNYDLASLAAIGTGGAATNLKHQQALLELLPQLTHHQRVRVVGNREHGFRAKPRRRPIRHLHLARGRSGVVRGLQSFSPRANTRWAGPPGKAGFPWVLQRSRCHPQDLSGGRRQTRGDIGRPRCAGGGRDIAALRSRLARRQHRRGEGVRRRSRRSAAGGPGCAGCPGDRPSQRTMGRGVGGADSATRRSPRGGRSARARCAAQLAGFKVPKEFIIVEQVHRLGNGKADYRWAKRQATEKAPMSR